MKNQSQPSYKKIVSNIVLVLGLTAATHSLFGQLPPPPLPPPLETVFETQTAIDDFADTGIITIVGNLRIADNGTDPITNLDGLSSLILVLGNVIVEGNDQLTSYCGLVTLLEMGLPGDFTFQPTGNFWNPEVEDILEACEYQDLAEVLSLEEVLQAFREDNVLNKGQVNSLTKQAAKSLSVLSKHLAAFVRAGILTEDEAGMILNAAELESADS